MSAEEGGGFAGWASSFWSLIAPALLARSSSRERVREELARHANLPSLALLCRRPADDPFLLAGLAAHPRLSRRQAARVARTALLYLVHPHRGQFGFAHARDALWQASERYGTPNFVLPTLLARLDRRDEKLWTGVGGRSRQDCLVEVLLGIRACGAEEIARAFQALGGRPEAMRLATHPACPRDVLEQLQNALQNALRPQPGWGGVLGKRQRLLLFLAEERELLSLPWVREALFQQGTTSLYHRIFQVGERGVWCDWAAELAAQEPGYVLQWLRDRPEDFQPEERKRLLGVLLASREASHRMEALRLFPLVLWSHAS